MLNASTIRGFKRGEINLYDLVAVGNPVYDEIITPQVRTEGRILSGCSTNACLAAKRLGLGRVALIGCIGKDYERRFRGDMSMYGVELPSIKLSEETGGFRLVYDSKGDRTLDVLGIAGKISPEDFPSKCLDAKVILLGPILNEIDLKFVKFLRESSNARIFLDPQGMVREIGSKGRVKHRCDRRIAKALVRLVDFVKPNENEAVTLTGAEDPFLSARLMVEWGAGVGIVTLAERGSLIYYCEKFTRIPAYKTLAKDPTGAGDIYAGAFISSLLKGKSVPNSALFASAAASIKVEYTGPDFPLDCAEVDGRVRKLNRLQREFNP